MTEERVAELEAQLAAAKRAHSEMKRRVITEARAMAQQHSLCDVVDQTLERAGLGPVLERVELSFDIPATLTMDVDATLLEGLDDAAKKMLIATKIAGGLDVSLSTDQMAGLIPQPVGIGQNRRHPRTNIIVGNIRVENVGEVEIPQPPPEPHNPPPGFIARYPNDRSRVLHYFPRQDERRPRDLAETLCGQVVERCRNLLTESPRGEDRVCARCETRAMVLREV